MLFGVVVGASVGAAVVEDGRVKPLLGRLMNGVGCVAPVSSFSTLAIVVDPNGFFVGRMRRLRTTLLPTLAAADRGSLLLNGRRTFDSASTVVAVMSAKTRRKTATRAVSRPIRKCWHPLKAATIL